MLARARLLRPWQRRVVSCCEVALAKPISTASRAIPSMGQLSSGMNRPQLEVWQARNIGMDKSLKVDDKKIRPRAKLQEESPDTGPKDKAKPVPVILKK